MNTDITKLTTEQRNPDSMHLDEMTPLEICTLMNEQDSQIIKAVHDQLPSIAKASAMAAECLKKGGRLIYCGAGTSGRLGVLDAVECPPTFGVSNDTVVGLMAGGAGSMAKAKEDAEDHAEFGKEDLQNISCNANDMVIGLAASGRTPYVIGALDYASSVGAATAAVACNSGSLVGQHADVAIEPVCGPEVLTGSTRLKSGTAHKMVLNMISTSAMIQCGKVYENLMVDVKPTNEKLVRRAESIISSATDCTKEEAEHLRIEANGHVKTAIVMKLKNCSRTEAETLLKNADGFVRKAAK